MIFDSLFAFFETEQNGEHHMKYVATVIALALSSIAAYFSVLGMIQIFPKFVTEIVILTLLLESAKVITAVYLHQNWGHIGYLIKAYLSSAAVILAIITSVGVYGFLMKSHVDQTKLINNGAVKEVSINNINRSKLKSELESIQSRIDLTNLAAEKKIAVAKKASETDLVGSDNESKLRELQAKKSIIVAEITKIDSNNLNLNNKVLEEASILDDVWFQMLAAVLVLTLDPLALTLLMSATSLKVDTKITRKRTKPKLIPARKKSKPKAKKKLSKNKTVFIQKKHIQYRGRPRSNSIRVPITKQKRR